MALNNLQRGFAGVAILSYSLSVCTALGNDKGSSIRRSFRSFGPHQRLEIRLVWVPRHAGVIFNELSDQLANLALGGPVLVNCSIDSFLLGARFRRLQILQINRQVLLVHSPTIFPFSLMEA